MQRRTKRVRKGIYNRCSGNGIPFWRMIVEEELHWLEEEKAELNKKKRNRRVTIGRQNSRKFFPRLLSRIRQKMQFS